MNVIGTRPDGWWRDRTGAMRRLVAALAEIDAEVCVVFDGRPRDLGDVGEVRVEWAPVADDLIAELADPASTVVTSDGPLAARVPGEVVSSGRFRRELGY
ncbi:MAG: hypothetical protein QOF76_2235 [Solirubrobacteraceae bacterium]|jgi:uncharacterized protein YaiI (UPF0178 family)|nr:hypothetical protein [Solirubrobacteraceae bacterium]